MIIRVGYDGAFTLKPRQMFAILLPQNSDSYARFIMLIWRFRPGRCGGLRFVWRPYLSAGFLKFEIA